MALPSVLHKMLMKTTCEIKQKPTKIFFLELMIALHLELHTFIFLFVKGKPVHSFPLVLIRLMARGGRSATGYRGETVLEAAGVE